MTHCIKHMVSEYEDAKEYLTLASECSNERCKHIYRELCSSELEHFEKLLDAYHCLQGEDSAWVTFFKHQVEELRSKLRQL